MRLPSIGWVFAAILALSSCAEVRSGQIATPAERSAARDLVSQLVAVASQPTSADKLLSAVGTKAVLTLVAPRGVSLAAPATGDVTATYGLDDCVIATSGSATFTGCEIADHVVDGTWSAKGRRVHTEIVDVFVLGPEQHGSFALNANLLRRGESGASSLSGTVDISINWTTSAGDHFLDATVRADNLAVDEFGCASGGTIAITGSLGEQSLGTTTLWFGPGCQDVQISH